MTIFGITTPLTPGILLAVFIAALGLSLTLRRQGYSLTGGATNKRVLWPWLLLFSQLMAAAIFFLFR